MASKRVAPVPGDLVQVWFPEVTPDTKFWAYKSTVAHIQFRASDILVYIGKATGPHVQYLLHPEHGTLIVPIVSNMKMELRVVHSEPPEEEK